MKTHLFTLALILFSAYSFAQTSLYEHPKFEEYAKAHKTVAILPFNTSITLRPKDMKSMAPGQLEKMEQDEGISVQNGMHSWFLKRDNNELLLIWLVYFVYRIVVWFLYSLL